MGRPSVERTTAQEEEWEEAYPEEHQEGLGFPHLLHSERELTSSP